MAQACAEVLPERRSSTGVVRREEHGEHEEETAEACRTYEDAKNEREPDRSGSVYNTMLTIGPSGLLARHRDRLAPGLLVGLALAAYSLIILGPGAELSQMVPVLRAAQAIQAGNTITNDALTTSLIRAQDPSVLATLLRDTDRSRIIGQVAAMDVPADRLAGLVHTTEAGPGRYTP